MTIFSSGSHIAAALDTETTGLDSHLDEIIEIGIQLFRFEVSTGRITERLTSYTALQAPTLPVTPEIQRITGITHSMLAGQKIDWDQVDALLQQADLIIAHHAGFDRGFVDRKSKISPEKLWACSSFQVDWRGKGFRNARLQDLCASLGIAYDAHRALSDVQAMIQLMGSEDVFTGKPYLSEILDTAGQEVVWLWVEGKTYDQRDLLKAHGFRWSGAQKVWGKIVPLGEHLKVIESAQSLIPGTTVRSRHVAMKDRFKITV